MEKNHSLTKNSIYYLLNNVLNVVFPFAAGIYVAHILLPADIGQFEAARNLAQYFVILAFLGIPTYGIREIAKLRNNETELRKLHTELFVINFFSTCLFLCTYLAIIFAAPVYRDSLLLHLITGISIALNFFNNSWLFEGLEKFRYISLRNTIFKAVSFLLLIIFVRKQGDYILYAIITVVGTAGNYLLNIISSKRFFSNPFKGLNLKKHIKPILFLSVVNLAIEIYTLTDITMLNLFCTKEIVAYYSYGMKIQKILLQVINTFTMVLVPRIAFYYGEGKIDEFNKLLTKTLKVILLLGCPMIVGIFFVSDFFIVFIYGANYISSSVVLKVLSFMLVISPVGYLLGSRVMLVTGNEKKMYIPVVAGAIVNVALNSILIHFFNEIGAAIASVVSEIVVAAVYLSLSHKFFKLTKMLPFVWKTSLSIALMSAFLLVLFFADFNAIVKNIIMVVGAIMIYFFALYLSKEEVVRDTSLLFFRKIGFKKGKNS